MAASTTGMTVEQTEEYERDECFLVTLSDELLLKLMSYLPTCDLLSLQEVNRKFGEICVDSSLWRNIDLQRCYCVTTHTLWEIGRLAKGAAILSFNISHCYWLTSNQLCIINPRMSNLNYLDIRGTAVSVKVLNQILSSASSLRSLSYEHWWMMKAMDFSEAAKDTWSQLRELNVVITKSCLQTYLFSLCSSLEAFSLDTVNQTFESYLCKCEGSLLSCLNLRDLKYVHIGSEVKLLHPHCCNYSVYNVPYGYGFLSAMTLLCHISFSLSKYMLYAESWAMHAEYAQILSLEIDKMCNNAFLESPRMQSIRHLSIQRMSVTQKYLSPVKNYSQLRSINISGCQIVFPREEGEEVQNLSFIKSLIEAKIPLRHLNISGVHLHQNTDNRLGPLLEQLKGLKSLSLPICGLAENGQSQPAWMTSSQQPADRGESLNDRSSGFSKRRRVGIRTNVYNMCDTCVAGVPSSADKDTEDKQGCIYCCSNLARIVNGNPSMKSFELMGVDSDSVLSKQNVFCLTHKLHMSTYAPCRPSSSMSVCEDTLLSISRWTHLHSLVLAGLPTVLRGHCLVAITQNCKQLHRLSLAHLGLSGQCQYLKGLCEALQYASHLEDLRLEQLNIDGMYLLFRALRRCPSITRLCIISKNGKVNPADVCVMFNDCPKLILLYLICSLTVAACRNLKQEVLGKFGNSRPALRVVAGQYPTYTDQLRECLKGMPDIHLREFLLFDSRVATEAPSWRELEAIQAAEGRDSK